MCVISGILPFEIYLFAVKTICSAGISFGIGDGELSPKELCVLH